MLFVPLEAAVILTFKQFGAARKSKRESGSPVVYQISLGFKQLAAPFYRCILLVRRSTAPVCGRPACRQHHHQNKLRPAKGAYCKTVCIIRPGRGRTGEKS
jgi:hypothetical protein